MNGNYFFVFFLLDHSKIEQFGAQSGTFAWCIFYILFLNDSCMNLKKIKFVFHPVYRNIKSTHVAKIHRIYVNPFSIIL